MASKGLLRAIADRCPAMQKSSALTVMASMISDSCPYLRTTSMISKKARRIHEQPKTQVQQFMEQCPFAKVLVGHELLHQEGKKKEESAARLPQPYGKADFGAVFESCVTEVQEEGRYREFANLERRCGRFPVASPCEGERVAEDKKEVVMWCSNDYLGMGQDQRVTHAMHLALDQCGAGSGGTRNIAGTSRYHAALEAEMADLHGKGGALLFSSCYVANSSTLETLGGLLPDAVIFSDEKNHASLIEGIRHSKLDKHIFRHNDPSHLRSLLASCDPARPKIIVFESVYSMDGTVAPVGRFCDLAEEFGALTFIDEVHSVGLYGARGGGIAEMQGEAHRVDIVSGTFGKAFGVYGGYVAGGTKLVDALRCKANGFIFTTSLPPVVAAGCLASVRHLKNSQAERRKHQERAATLLRKLQDAGLPALKCDSHIIPVVVGDAVLCKKASDLLIRKHGVYVQPINFPTVPRGSERFRLTPSPNHTDAMMDHLVQSMGIVFMELGIPTWGSQ